MTASNRWVNLMDRKLSITSNWINLKSLTFFLNFNSGLLMTRLLLNVYAILQIWHLKPNLLFLLQLTFHCKISYSFNDLYLQLLSHPLLKISYSNPLWTEDTFQDPLWMPETRDSTESYVIFSYILHLIRFSIHFIIHQLHLPSKPRNHSSGTVHRQIQENYRSSPTYVYWQIKVIFQSKRVNCAHYPKMITMTLYSHVSLGCFVFTGVFSVCLVLRCLWILLSSAY